MCIGFQWLKYNPQTESLKAYIILGCYAALVDSRLSTFRYDLSVPSSRVEESRNCMTLEGRTDVAHRNVGN